MKRVSLFSSVAFGVVAFAATIPFATASAYDDARKICAERYDLEKSSGTVPAGMSKERYLGQCQRGYMRNIKLQEALDDVDKAKPADNIVPSKNVLKQNGQGGPEILPPQNKRQIQTPRFKPTI